ncbi:hypothetical protein JXA56_02550 [Candidatus Micrarchaeota archaeon]|nr:hypothetical protein [Candidatus Micrarchaeota archaeon]
MQSLESIISFFFFISITTAIMASYSPQQIDDSLYILQLAEDSWRVAYLRGAFENSPSRESLEKEFAILSAQTDLCFFIDGIYITSCRGGEKHQMTASLSRTIIHEGEPKAHTFSIGK